MVPKAGLEPAHPKAVDFESTASTDFATSALKGSENGDDYTCQKRIRNIYPFKFVQMLKKESLMIFFNQLRLNFKRFYPLPSHNIFFHNPFLPIDNRQTPYIIPNKTRL
ncbi:conserved protein of unknown function [Xenorhabdus poinarii G6]|uniref:Uncharacterized protein n=1 Tax=Xenorhabdus poinarii G6 TaxID=1354304 RepID=A0A068QZC8_9GAMM|nr:conserved protein of unknown function [Xenorhabdus poinarii G6]